MAGRAVACHASQRTTLSVAAARQRWRQRRRQQEAAIVCMAGVACKRATRTTHRCTRRLARAPGAPQAHGRGPARDDSLPFAFRQPPETLRCTPESSHGERRAGGGGGGGGRGRAAAAGAQHPVARGVWLCGEQGEGLWSRYSIAWLLAAQPVPGGSCLIPPLSHCAPAARSAPCCRCSCLGSMLTRSTACSSGERVAIHQKRPGAAGWGHGCVSTASHAAQRGPHGSLLPPLPCSQRCTAVALQGSSSCPARSSHPPHH